MIAFPFSIHLCRLIALFVTWKKCSQPYQAARKLVSWVALVEGGKPNLSLDQLQSVFKTSCVAVACIPCWRITTVGRYNVHGVFLSLRRLRIIRLKVVPGCGSCKHILEACPGFASCLRARQVCNSGDKKDHELLRAIRRNICGRIWGKGRQEHQFREKQTITSRIRVES